MRLLDLLSLFFAALAVAVRPLLPGQGAELNLWVEACLFVAGMIWIVRRAMERRVRLARTGLAAPLGVLLAIAAVSTLRSPHPIASLATLLEWLSYGVLFVILANLASEQADPRFFLRLLWASAFAVVLFGLFQQFVNLPLAREQIEADPERVKLTFHLSEQNYTDFLERARGRIFATFLLANSFAGFLALVFPGFLGYVLDRVRAGRAGKALLAAAGLWMAGALACLVYTGSKGGAMAFAVGLAAFGLLAAGRVVRRHARWIAAAAAVAVLALAALAAAHRLPRAVRDAAASYDVRLGYWRGALAMVAAHPAAGVGLATFGDHYPRYRWPVARMARAAHNDFLQVAAELGLLGLAAFLWLWVAYFRSAAAQRAEQTNAEGGTRKAEREDSQTAAGRKPSAEVRTDSSFVIRHSSSSFPPRLGYIAGILALLLVDTLSPGTLAFGGWGTEPRWQALPKAWCDRGLLAALGAAWLGFYALLGRREADAPGPLCRKGLVAGVIALLFHMTGDFDYSEPAVAMTAWVLVALSVVPRRPAREWRPGPAAAFLVGAGALLASAAFLLVVRGAAQAAVDRDAANERAAQALRPAAAEDPEKQRQQLWEAIELYDRALRENPLDDSLRLDFGNLLTRLLSKDLLDPPHRFSLDALDRRAAGMDEWMDPRQFLFRRAAALYERAAELNTASAGPHLRLAELCALAADFGQSQAWLRQPLAELAERYGGPGPYANPLFLPAVAELRAAVERDPNLPSWRLRLAAALAKLGERAEALREVRHAERLNTALLRAHRAHELRLRFEEHTLAAQLDPRSGLPRLRLGEILEADADDGHESPQSHLARYLLSLVGFWSYGLPAPFWNYDYLPAVAEFRAAIEREPERPGWRLRLAEAIEKVGDRAAALREARLADGLNARLLRDRPGGELRLRDDELVRLHALLARCEPGS